MTKESHRHPIWVLLDQLQMDNRAQAAKLIEIRSYVANLALPEEHLHHCPECQASHRHAHALAEHRYHCHAGAVPEHYLAAERLAGIEPNA